MRIYSQLLFFLAALFLSASLHSQSLSFKSCADDPEKDICNVLGERNYRLKFQEISEKLLGCAVNDSVSFEFEVNEKGILKIKNYFFMITQYDMKKFAQYFVDLGSALLPNQPGESYTWSFSLEIPTELQSYKLYSEMENPPLTTLCKDMNEKGQKACFRYLFTNAQYFYKNSNGNEDISVRYFIKKGKVVAIDFNEVPLSDKIQNSLVDAVNEQFELYTTENTWLDTEGFYIDYERYFRGDSIERREHANKKLEYFITFPQKEYYLQELLDYTGTYYFKSRDEGNEFLLNGLISAGYGNSEMVQVGRIKLSVDSLRSYKYTEGDTDHKLLNFAEVESVPVFKGCKKGETNVEKRNCFQNELLRHVSKTFVYPEEARMKNIQGKVYVAFVVEKDGSFDQIDIVRGTNVLLDIEAIRVVSEIEDCDRPAINKGEPVRMSFVLPINAKLQ